MGFKEQANKLNEKLEQVKLERLKLKVDVESQGLLDDKTNLEKSKITNLITKESLTQEQLKLSTARLTTQVTKIGELKTGDKLKFETADRLLTQQEYRAKLELKTISVHGLFEEVRHQKVMNGTGNNSPRQLK
jgi:hypothetical protein